MKVENFPEFLDVRLEGNQVCLNFSDVLLKISIDESVRYEAAVGTTKKAAVFRNYLARHFPSLDWKVSEDTVFCEAAFPVSKAFNENYISLLAVQIATVVRAARRQMEAPKATLRA